MVVTQEDLTTMTHSSRTGWTIMRGTWNHLRKVWGPTPDTLAKIQTSCKTQESLEGVNVFSPTRHLFLTIKRLWRTQDLNTVYLWDTMDNEDRQDYLETLREKDNWVIWKTKDNKWTQDLQWTGVRLLSLNKNTRVDCWDKKIKGWWRRGDIKTTKCKKTRE